MKLGRATELTSDFRSTYRLPSLIRALRGFRQGDRLDKDREIADRCGIFHMAAARGIKERSTWKGRLQSVFTEGEADAALFIVMSGIVRIDKQVSAEQQQTLHQLKAGEFFGEISFVRGGEHIASAQAVQDAEVLLIRRTEFDKLAARNPAVGNKIILRMAGQMATLLRHMDEKFVELVSYIYGRSKK